MQGACTFFLMRSYFWFLWSILRMGLVSVGRKGLILSLQAQVCERWGVATTMVPLPMVYSLQGVPMSPAERKGRRCPYLAGRWNLLELEFIWIQIKSFRKDLLECQSLKMDHVKRVNEDNNKMVINMGVLGWAGSLGTSRCYCVIVCVHMCIFCFCFAELTTLL